MKKIILFLWLFITAVIAKPQVAATFEDLQLPFDSFWNGSDESGKFTSGPFTFYNSYNKTWASWSGFAYSNSTDKTTPGWSNQYSAIPGKGVFNSNNYAVGYDYGTLRISMSKPDSLTGVFITNSTYTYLTLRDGNEFAKKFGGTSGEDPDYFILKITGLGNKGDTTGTVTFYLADFRLEDPQKDFIIREWTWVDLSSLGIVSELRFSLESSDTGLWGMNTPAYFCLDDLHHQDMAPVVKQPLPDIVWNPGYNSRMTIPLDSVFFDPDNPELDGTYAVQSLEGTYVADIRLMTIALTWNKVSHAIDISILPGTSGSEKVTIVYTSNGKSVALDFRIHVNTTTSFMPVTHKNFRVYPNPFRDVLSVELPENTGSVRVNDMNGRLVYREDEPFNGEAVINALKVQPPGVYILTVSGREILKGVKLIKE